MLSDRQTELASNSIRTSQITAGALILGAMFFAGTITFVVVDWSQLGGPVKLMSTLAAASTIIFFGLSMVVPSLFPTLPNKISPSDTAGGNDRAIDEIGKLLTSKTVVRLILLEACIFTNVLPLMFEPRWVNLVAIGIAAIVMLFFFPRMSGQLPKIESNFADWRAGVRQ